MMSRGRTAVIVLAVALLASSAVGAAEGYKGFARGDALITVEELKGLMDADDPKLVVVAVAKPESYKLGHIPGSLNVWRPDYEPAEGEPWPFGGMILDRATFQDFARGLGVDNDSKVVVYDEKYDATRLWWAFYMYGKTDVRVLDGGYQAWKAAGYDVDRSLFSATADELGDFTAAQPNEHLYASMDEVWLSKESGDYQLWDTRETNEWTGEKMKKGAFREGRIPWAKFQNWKEFKVAVEEGGAPTAFKTADGIQQVIDTFGMDQDKTQVFYCQSGVRTTTNMFALYLMGWDPEKLANYDGSWIQWSYFENNPVVDEK